MAGVIAGTHGGGPSQVAKAGANCGPTGSCRSLVISMQYFGYWVSPWVPSRRGQLQGLVQGCAGTQLEGLGAGECSDASQWQKAGPYTGPQTDRGTGCWYALPWLQSPLRHAHCSGGQCTAGRAGPEYTYSSDGQPQESRLVSLASAAIKAWIPAGAGGRPRVKRDSGCWYQRIWIPVRQKLVKSPGVHGGCAAIGFSGGESCQVCLQSRSLGTTITPVVWLLLAAPTFLLCS